MRKIKKVSTLLVLCCLCLCMGAVSASADYDRFSTTEYYFDVEMNYWGEYVEFNVSLDFDAMEARINSYSSDEVCDVKIPEYFEYDGDRFTVTDIAGGDKYNDYQRSAEIPSTVTYIAPQSVGYYLEEVEIDNSYYDDDGYYVEDYEYVYKLFPIEGFEIICEKGSAAERYALENDFECELFKDITRAEIIFDKSEYFYTGWEIEPQITVMLDETSLVNNVDYEVEYDSNVDAGQAVLTVTGLGQYRGTVTKYFDIKPADASMLTYSKVSTQYYYGYSISPYVEVTYGDLYLWSGYDYDVTYSDNTEPGTAKITFQFYGNYTGKKVIKFKIAMVPITNFTAYAGADYVTLSWDQIPCDEYRIYLYNTKTKKYDGVKKTKNNYYTHKSRKQLTSYKYAVKGIIYGENGTAKTKTVYVTVTTTPNVPKVTLVTKNKAVTVKWNKNSKVDGYQVYRMTNWDYEMTRVKTIKDKNTISWTNKGLSNDDDYYFAVRAFKKVNGKYVYSELSSQVYSGSSASRLDGATLKSKRSFKCYNVQGKETKLAWTTTLSDKDVKILKKFAKKHFTEDMSREDVLRVTLEWINRNVTYATGDLWYEIQGMSYVEAIFSAKKGQCVQYNGAMAAMMTYLGYDVKLIQGYRYSRYTGSTWQHFWVEAKINGNTYVFETGNYGRDGSWSYLCKKYSETMGYMRNGKRVS